MVEPLISAHRLIEDAQCNVKMARGYVNQVQLGKEIDYSHK